MKNSITCAACVRWGPLLAWLWVLSGETGRCATRSDPVPDFVWARQAGGTSQDVATGIATDHTGNVFAVGQFQVTASFGGTNVTSRGITDIFVAKYDTAGKILWVRQAGGADFDHATGVATDGTNCYVCGYFSGVAMFGGSSVTSNVGSDVFVAKYDSAGNLLWLRQAGGNLTDECKAIAVDRSGNAFVTGWFRGPAVFGGTILSSSGYADIFLAKYHPNGNVAWARRAGGTAFTFAEGRAVAVDSAGSAYLTGRFETTTAFGGISLTTRETNGWADIFVAKYDSSGNVLWATNAGGITHEDVSAGIAVDSTGCAYVTGQLRGDAYFGFTNLSSSSWDIFLAKYGDTGNLIWVRQAGGSLDADNGTAIATDTNGNCFVTGIFSGTAAFTTTNLSSKGPTDAFLAKYDTQGNMLWARQTGGTLSDWGSSVVADRTGNIWLAGSFSSVAGFGNTNLSDGGNGDVFVGRLSYTSGLTVLFDGQMVFTGPVGARSSATIALLTAFTNATLFFTLNGSDPFNSGRLYGGPFVVRQSVTLRAVAYNADFTQSVESDPLVILILPALNASAEGGGSVALDPPAGAYFSNDLGVVTATPSPGWTFLHWLGDETGTNPTASVSMTRNKCLRAVFGAGLNHTIVGSGSVVRSPAAEWYPHGTPVRLTAVPQAGNYFALWGNAATGTNNPLTFAVTNPNSTVTAVFAALPANQHALTVMPDGFGQVTASPRGNRFGNGTNVTLLAAPEADQEFLGWSGDANGTNNPLVVTMNRSQVITANFTKRPWLTPLLCNGLLNGEEIQLLVTGQFGDRFFIEGTTTFATAASAWEPLVTLTNIHGSVQFNDPFPTNSPRKFYRAVREQDQRQ